MHSHSNRRCPFRGATLALAAALALATGAQAQQVEIMSAGTSPPADAPSETANRPRFTVSDDGCFVVFTSLATKLVPSQDDTNLETDVFLYDRCRATPAVILVSHEVGKPEIAASGRSDQPVISPDGEFVVFRSTAANIVAETAPPGGYTGQTNVFVWERQADQFELASHREGDSQEPADRDSQNGVISRFGGGRFVAFDSFATDLVDTDDDTVSDVFRYEIGTGGTVDLISATNFLADPKANGNSFNPAISGPGFCIVYESEATNLVSDDPADDMNFLRDIFRWTPPPANPATILLSHQAGALTFGMGAITGDGESTEPSIDDVCEGFAFKSEAKDLVPSQTEFNAGTDVFHTRNSGLTTLVSHQDGTVDRTGTGGESLSPILSRDGQWVAYASLARDLAPGQDDPGAPSSDVFVFDVTGGKNTLVSHEATDPKRAADAPSFVPEISLDGSYIAYVSAAKGLDPNQNEGTSDVDVFLYNRRWNSSIVASRRFASIAITGAEKSYLPAISGDGYSVAFTSQANDLIADDPDPSSQPDAFLFVAPRDLPFLTARSTNNTNTLEWVTPPVDYVSMRMFFAPTCPATFSAVIPANEILTGSPPANFRGMVTDGPLAPDATVCYAIFLERDAGPILGGDAPARTITGRPFSDLSGRMRWSLNLADITALTQVGIGIQNHVAVANDGGVYSFTRGGGGGLWPASSRPFKVEQPIQGRPPVVGFGLLGSANTTFVGSQDGRAYAFNADRGAGTGAGGALWYTTPKLGTVVQPGASGMFTLFGGLANHILIGARTGTAGTFFALDGSNGTVRDAYSGSAPLGAIAGAASVHYAPANRVYFTSLEGIDDPSLWCLTLTATGFGSECWAPRSDPAGISGGPVQRSGKVYVGDDFGEVWAFDSATGNPAWPGSYFACPGSSVKGFVLADRGGTGQDLYYSTPVAVCAVTDGGTPTTKWTKTTIPNPSTPILARILGVAYVFVGSSDGHLYQIEADTPTAVTRVLLRTGSTIGPPAFDVFDNMVYAGSEQGILYAVEAPLP